MFWVVKRLTKKIAVFTNAFSEKMLSDALEGIREVAQREDYDIFAFSSFASPGMSEDEQREEKRIYQLPDMSEFDGIIVFSVTLNFNELVDDICERAVAANVPIVSIGSKVGDLPFVGLNTEESMCELVEHIVTVHGVRDIEFISGPKGNVNSELRISAIKKIFGKYDIPFDEECIHYSDYSVRGAMTIAEEFLKKRSGKKMPDAVICANDNLAMGACSEIEKIGLRVPEDVIITGFDNTYDGQVFNPALCTVAQDDYSVGKTAFEALLKRIKNEKADDVIIKNRFIKNQSCGCCNDTVNELRLKECKQRFYDKIKRFEFDWSNNWIAHSLLSSLDIKIIRKNLNKRFAESGMFNNSTTFVMEDSRASLYLAGKNDDNSFKGYSDSFTVLSAVDRGKIVNADTVTRRQLIPGYQKKEGESRLFIIMPVHFQDWVYGYVVLEDWLIGITTGWIKIFLDGFNQAVDKLKLNMSLEHLNSKLRDLYTKDSLTGMYNRFGFNSEGIKIYDDARANGKKMVLMFSDINRMKLINDYYGHLQGDMAIKTVAEAIRQEIPEDWISIRFGGDEFLIIGQCDDEGIIEDVQKRITDNVRDTGRRMSFPFYLSVSCGYLFFMPENDRALDSYIKQADEAMYEIKAYMHTSDKELRKFEEQCKNNQL